VPAVAGLVRVIVVVYVCVIAPDNLPGCTLNGDGHDLISLPARPRARLKLAAAFNGPRRESDPVLGNTTVVVRPPCLTRTARCRRR
jgi:hypothetical protein